MRYLLFILLFSSLFGGDSELEDFDDDAFLSSKIEPSAPAGDQIGWSLFRSKDGEERYVINFRNVSIVEYIGFISRISDLNFQYEEAELNFPITVVSEEPLTIQNIVSALIQTLRARGFNILEQEGSMLITSSKAINQIPALVLPDKSKKETTAPIVTRVFRINNADLGSLASILKPMMSESSMIEISAQTKQLIITDITTNVEKIAQLLKTLDSAHSPLEIEVYKTRHMGAENLIKTTEQILAVFKEGNPLIFVPQNQTNTIFIISTPHLIERSIEIMEDLDKKPSPIKGPAGDQVYIYQVQNIGASQLLDILDEIGSQLKKAGAQSSKLIAVIKSGRGIDGTNSIMFITDLETEVKLGLLLKTLDTPVKKGAVVDYTYWIYTPEFLTGKDIENVMEEIEDGLSDATMSDEGLSQAIESMQWVPSISALMFFGDPKSLEKIQTIMKRVDVPTSSASKIFIYSPKFLNYEQIEEALDELADKLNPKYIKDKNLAKAIDDMTWVPDTRTFIFKADPDSITKIEEFLSKIDIPRDVTTASASGYYLYYLKHATGESVLDHLEKVAKNLSTRDPEQKGVIEVIDDATYLKDSNSILLTGPKKAVEEVKNLITQYDVVGAKPTSAEKTSFFIYKPEHVTVQQLHSDLEKTAKDLKMSGLIDEGLLQTIDTMRLVKNTGSLVFSGTKESLEKVKQIIEVIDVPGGQRAFEEGEDEEKLAELEKEKKEENFFIYKPKYESPEKILSILKEVAQNLPKIPANKGVIKSIRSARVVKESKSILFTGTPDTLAKIESMLKEYDVPDREKLAEEGIAPGDYVIYKPMNVSGPELIEMMQEFEQNLMQSGVREPNLFKAINNLKYIQRTKHILISGEHKAVEKVKELLQKFDVPGQQTAAVTSLHQMERSFLVYKLQYHKGGDLQETLKKIGDELASSGDEKSELLKAINSLQWIKITNSLLATGTPVVLTQLKELIQSVDVPLRQVFIEVLIIETTLNNNQQFGLQWGGKVQYLNRFAGGTSNFPSTNPAAPSLSQNLALQQPLIDVNATRTPLPTDIPNPSGNGGFDLGVIGDIILHRGKSFISLASLVNAIQQDSDSVVVMNPKIIAQDNQLSTIFVGQNIPFTGSNVTTQGGINQQISTNIEYRDVGINLAITPIITNDIVTLDISNEITAQVANTTSGTNIQGLQTSRTSLNAKVHVPDRHFVALSGMIQDTKSHFKSGIPCLGGLPVIGAIFSENDRFNSRNNIIFFIRPVIIDSIEEYEKITENQEQQFKERGVKQIVKEEIDDAIDMVKDPGCDY